ncbi:hypothetical protein TUBRATIS_009310 [Tubulinosema ratisbonensis]|uniref:Uncharacterized protein n=1 Tax=Tubulinosema ratisbonensis TaxID=291195 RepID=A0A437AN14_9MICR|nr:hypothetical protein TUBRATIS_009310 [Tubulinosema ratisbonensis]
MKLGCIYFTLLSCCCDLDYKKHAMIFSRYNEIDYLLDCYETNSLFKDVPHYITENNKLKLLTTLDSTSSINLIKLSQKIIKKDKLTLYFEILILNLIILKKCFNVQPTFLIINLTRTFINFLIYVFFFKGDRNSKEKRLLIIYLLPCIYSKDIHIPENFDVDTYFYLNYITYTAEEEDIKIFNSFVLKFYLTFKKKFDNRYRFYMNRIQKTKDIPNHFWAEYVSLFILRMLKSKIFSNLKLFCPYLENVYDKIDIRSCNHLQKNKIHHFLTIILLKYKTIVETIFVKTSLLFSAKFIPIYKLIVLQNLFFNILLYTYLCVSLVAGPCNTPQELILHTYKYYKSMYITTKYKESNENNKERLQEYKKLVEKKIDTFRFEIENASIYIIKTIS